MSWDPAAIELSAWFRTPLGRLLAEAELDAVRQALGDVAGRCVVQYSGHGEALSLPGVDAHFGAVPGPDIHAVARADAVPLRASSVHVLVLSHALEWSADPCAVLTQAARVLAPEGRLVVVGFNPVSLWGLERAMPRQHHSGPPAGGRYFAARRVRDWCTLLDLEPLPGRTVFFRPPVKRQDLQRRLQLLERLGGRLLPWSGGVHVLLSRKRVAGLRPPGLAVRGMRPMVLRPIPGACQAWPRSAAVREARGSIHTV